MLSVLHSLYESTAVLGFSDVLLSTLSGGGGYLDWWLVACQHNVLLLCHFGHDPVTRNAFCDAFTS
jgi:hypothetical protein